MRGYIHTIEIILSILLVLFALAQFSSLYTKGTPWARNYLYLLSRDTVYTANFLGDDWQNSSFATSSIKKILFSDFIEYEFGLKNSIKRDVFVGCSCSPAELTMLQQQLSSFTLNGRKINFKVSDTAGVQDWNSLDVIVYGHYQNMEADKEKLLDFLANDKGVMLFSPVTQAQISSDSVLRDIFGLKWVTNSAPLSTDDVFVADHPPNRSYYIKKYFYGFRASDSTTPLNSELGLGPISCTNSTHEGFIKTRGVAKKFWIMDNSEKPSGGTYCDYVVYVDENANNEADSNEGPYIAGNNSVALNGFLMTLKSINTQVYNEKVEAETAIGDWTTATSKGLCSGDNDDLCSDGEGTATDTRDEETEITINVARPDTYEIWTRSYRGTTPALGKKKYFLSIDDEDEIPIDPFFQNDPSFAGPWGWNRTMTVLLELGTHTITLRSPTAVEAPTWENSAVDWVFLRNTTFNVKNDMEFLFNRNYKFVDFSKTGPYPDDEKVERMAVGSENKYDGLNGPVASVIVKDGITERKAGRAVWIADNKEGEDFKTLVRAAVIWSSPKEFIGVKNPSLGGSSTQAYTILEGGDMLNPYQIFVTLWYSRRFD